MTLANIETFRLKWLQRYKDRSEGYVAHVLLNFKAFNQDRVKGFNFVVGVLISV